MPRVVDHDARRTAVAQAVASIASRSGIEAATVRSVAAATGFSTTVVSHYFADKREMLLHAYRLAATRATTRLQAAVERHDGNVAKAMEALLPVDEEVRRDWLAWFSFWGPAIGDPDLAAEQRRQMRRAVRWFEVLLREAPKATRLPADRIPVAARSLLTLLMGIAVQAAFDPRDWPAARQREQLAIALARR